MAAFLHASRQPPADKAGRTGPTLVRALTRAVVVKVAAGAATLVLSGAALAAETGNLPDGAQQRAHEMFSSLGVPAPRSGAGTPTRPSSPPATASGGSDQRGVVPGKTPDQRDDNPGRGVNGTGGPAQPDAEIMRLCRDYRKDQRKPNGNKKLDADEMKKLETAAGGAANVSGYCDQVLADDEHGSPAHKSQPSADPGPSPKAKHSHKKPPSFPGRDGQPHPSLS